MAASQARASRPAGYPIVREMPMTIASPMIVWIRLPSTWPVRTAPRAMAIVRNRSMMPSVMSIATDSAVPSAPRPRS